MISCAHESGGYFGMAIGIMVTTRGGGATYLGKLSSFSLTTQQDQGAYNDLTSCDDVSEKTSGCG